MTSVTTLEDEPKELNNPSKESLPDIMLKGFTQTQNALVKLVILLPHL